MHRRQTAHITQATPVTDTNVPHTPFSAHNTVCCTCGLQENKDAFEIETLEVELFGPDGRIKDIWMFRWGTGGLGHDSFVCFNRGGKPTPAGHTQQPAAGLGCHTCCFCYGGEGEGGECCLTTKTTDRCRPQCEHSCLWNRARAVLLHCMRACDSLTII